MSGVIYFIVYIIYLNLVSVYVRWYYIENIEIFIFK